MTSFVNPGQKTSSTRQCMRNNEMQFIREAYQNPHTNPSIHPFSRPWTLILSLLSGIWPERNNSQTSYQRETEEIHAGAVL